MDGSALIEWARAQAEALRADMTYEGGDTLGGGGYWKAVDPEAAYMIRARAVAALEFFRRYAGPESEWWARASHAFDNAGDRQSMESGARMVGDFLLGWAAQVEAGVIPLVGLDEWEARQTATTDLMEQARVLNADKDVHPAAPVVLIGAALEIALRAAGELVGVPPPARPSIASYAESLRHAGVLSRQDLKDVTQMAGLRNEAAHGHLDDATRERAALLEQQANLFIGRLMTRVESHEATSPPPAHREDVRIAQDRTSP